MALSTAYCAPYEEQRRRSLVMPLMVHMQSTSFRARLWSYSGFIRFSQGRLPPTLVLPGLSGALITIESGAPGKPIVDDAAWMLPPLSASGHAYAVYSL